MLMNVIGGWNKMNIKERLQEVFRDVFDDESIVIFEEMTAEDIEEWDSLKQVQLIVASEQKFNITFKTNEVMELKNVGEFMALIRSKLI